MLCKHKRAAKTGHVMLTMPVQHERSCPDCGARFWAIPKRMGEAWEMVGAQQEQGQ